MAEGRVLVAAVGTCALGWGCGCGCPSQLQPHDLLTGYSPQDYKPQWFVRGESPFGGWDKYILPTDSFTSGVFYALPAIGSTMPGLTLPAWAVLSLYSLVTVLTHLILIDPNPPTPAPTPLPKKKPDPAHVQPTLQSPEKPTTLPVLHEPLLVRFATNPTVLSISRITSVILPVHLTLLHYLHTIYPLVPGHTVHTSLDLLCPYHPHSPAFLRTLTPPTLLGILLVLFSAPLRLLCFYQLGPSFTFTLTPPRAGLVKSGLYRYVRHPSYTCALLSMVGFFLTFAAPGGVMMRCFLGEESQQGWGRSVVVGVLCVAWAVAVEVFRERMIGEERLLQEMFGDEWSEYASRTKKMVPGVY